MSSTAPDADAKKAAEKAKRKAQLAAKKARKAELRAKDEEFAARLAAQNEMEEQMAAEVAQDGEPTPVETAPLYQSEQITAPFAAIFKGVFDKFLKPEELTAPKTERHDDDEGEVNNVSKGNKEEGEKDEDAANGEEPGKPLSRKELKARRRVTVAVLKQLVSRPEVIETHDCNSHDPKLLVTLKSYRNTVPVPSHWCQKRKYLQNKRGIEKVLWELPKFIADTGIGALRDAQQEKEANMNLKQKMRAKVQPKSGRMDVDYTALHDAFFRYQTKPHFSGHGSLYFEGKEFEVKLKAKQPGMLSDELMRALGMSSDKSPPPWLPAMQRYGPPPSYAHLKIPGVNAQIPPGARWGDNEWGKPPVDQYGRPLWGDIFGSAKEDNAPVVDSSLWGTIQEAAEGEEEAQDEDETDEDEDADNDEAVAEGTESTMAGMETPSGTVSESGISSIASTPVGGLETPESLQLRKKDGTGTETPDQIRKEPRSLYTVLEPKQVDVGGGLFGTTHTYVVPAAGAAAGAAAGMSEADRLAESKRRAKRGEVDVALAPEDLEGGMDAETLKRRYDAQLGAEQGGVPGENMSELMEERSKKKRKIAGGQKSKMKKIF